MSIASLVIGVYLVVALPTGAQAGDWPRWRGPNNDGVSAESGWTTDWPESGPKVLWKRDDIGVGFSTVSVANGRVYTMGNVEKGGAETDVVWCLDAGTGEEIWSHTYPCRRGQYKGTRATPTVDGDHVYTLSREGHLFCLEAKGGKVVWKKDVKADFGVQQTKYNWGLACSPLVLGDRLILDLGKTLALDKKDGKLIWSSGGDQAGFSSPTTIEIDGDTYINSFNAYGLVVVRAKDGKELDRAKWETSYQVNAASPIAWDGKIFVSSGYDYGCGVFEVRGGELQEVYRNREMRNHCNSCVLYKGHLYGLDGQMGGRATLKCLEPGTGKVVWEHKDRVLSPGGIMIAGGKIIAMLDKGTLLVAEAKPDGYEELARAKVLEGQCWTVPVLSNGKIYCRNNNEGILVCLDVSK